MLVDQFGRKHDYLRISVTDRCNLKCVYCMPGEGIAFKKENEILSFSEIVEVVRVASSLGIRKLRLTGGEPFLRQNLENLIEHLSSIEGIEDIALSTNGIHLGKKAETLKKAGITRVNISLDTLQEERFRMITRGGDIHKVFTSLDASYQVGFDPIKINVVLMKGINEDEIIDFLQLTIDRILHVRFIEYMPIGHSDRSWKEKYLPLEKVLQSCVEVGWKIDSIDSIYGNGPSQNFRIEGAKGTFGLIHPVSEHFCQSCNRLRLTADGHLKPCLYWNDEFNVRNYLGNTKDLEELFSKVLRSKPESHEMANVLHNQPLTHMQTIRRMSQIGG